MIELFLVLYVVVCLGISAYYLREAYRYTRAFQQLRTFIVQSKRLQKTQ